MIEFLDCGIGSNPSPTSPPVNNTVVTGWMGQSELAYLTDPGGIYRTIPQAVPGNNNLITVLQSGLGNPPTRVAVNPGTVAAGLVNPAMAALSAFLAYVKPGTTFVMGDLHVSGTSRVGLFSDVNDVLDDRSWTDFTSVINQVESEFGTINHLIECWYNADSAFITNFKPNFWPGYFGVNDTGTPFTLGNNNINGNRVDHCIYDALVPPTQKGRGVFARSNTKWHILTPMPFMGAPESGSGGQEMNFFSENAARQTEPARQVMRNLATDPIAISTGVVVGPSAHITKYTTATGASNIHPDHTVPDGQILFLWAFAVAMLRAAGDTVLEPEIVGIEAAPDGSWADLLVSLPNGGTLKTVASQRGSPPYAGSAPHQQPVTGVEITRSGAIRRPVFKTTETTYPVTARGTVTIVDTGTGTGAGRRGKVRITPTTPFGFGDVVSYLRGQATAGLLFTRDGGLYPYFLIEHIPSYYDATATYPFEGIAVRPQQDDLAVPVIAPLFLSQGAQFNGSTWFRTGSSLVPATTNGCMSLWVNNTAATWVTGSTVFQFRVGNTAVFSLASASTNRYTFVLNNSSGTNAIAFNAPGNVPFALNTWYHIAVSWTNTGCQVYVDGTLRGSFTYTSLNMANQMFTSIGIGANSSGAVPWTGGIGHMYINFDETIDFSNLANRQKFALAGRPVDVGPQGELPTGNRPSFYLDGTAPAWGNRGYSGSISITGSLTAPAIGP
jgi:hypothetical protein